MCKQIDGINFIHKDNYAACYIYNFSDEFKEIIRLHLTTVCYGAAKANNLSRAYNYKTTLKNFMDRFNSKSIETKKGMIGELLVHILILELFPKFQTISPYFNMEEKSIRKGFDVLLYENNLKEVWITEVKAGELHQSKCCNETTKALLSTAFYDLKKRLNEQEQTFWDNAINSAKIAIEDNKDYKKVIEEILEEEIVLISKNESNSKDNNVILVSVLFENVKNPIDQSIPKEFSENQERQNEFKKLIVLSIQKNTYKKVVDFFTGESK